MLLEASGSEVSPEKDEVEKEQPRATD